MSAKPFTCYEFFAGGGMAAVGLGAGWRPVFANDFDAAKASAYADNLGAAHLRVGDVWGLATGDLPGRAARSLFPNRQKTPIWWLWSNAVLTGSDVDRDPKPPRRGEKRMT